jgi:hypothetical protein
MSIKIVSDVSKIRVSNNRGNRSEDLNAIRSIPEGKYAIIPFNPAESKPSKEGQPPSFQEWANRKRSSLYKRGAKPTLSYKPRITTGDLEGQPCLIVERPKGSNYVTDPNGALVLVNDQPVTEAEHNRQQGQGSGQGQRKQGQGQRR